MRLGHATRGSLRRRLRVRSSQPAAARHLRVRRRPTTARVAQTTQPPGPLPRRCRSPHQPPEAQLRAAPITAQRPRRRRVLGRLGSSGLQPGRLAARTSSPPDSLPTARPARRQLADTAADRAAGFTSQTGVCPGQAPARPSQWTIAHWALARSAGPGLSSPTVRFGPADAGQCSVAEQPSRPQVATMVVLPRSVTSRD
jgi:hypothetical protein